jgi:hypothetical protein
VATLFWTLLWGPVGLLLATPLTVCLVVLGRHIETLQFIEVLLGDEPALEPEERFYRRLLAGDGTEAADMAEQGLRDRALSAYYDAMPMRALALAHSDAAHGKLTHESAGCPREYSRLPMWCRQNPSRSIRSTPRWFASPTSVPSAVRRMCAI